MAETIIDVIIPVYNGEEFIETIFNTLEEQTFRKFKAVFVDDGSTDNSLSILQEKIKSCSFDGIAVHKENGGLSSARNAGIKNSDSPWITFVDCDDKLDPHYLEFLLRSVTENNTVIGYCGYQGIPYDSQDKIVPVDNYSCDIISAEECMKLYYTNWVGAWSFIISREWLLSNDLLFDEMCTYCEDIPFITRAIEAADKVSKLNNDVYIYLYRQGSLIRSPKMDKYKNGIEAFLRMAEIVENKDSDAAKVFNDMGKARYMLATLRKSAAQLPINGFLELTAFVDEQSLKKQISNLSLSQKLAGYIYIVSKRIFYYFIHFLFKD